MKVGKIFTLFFVSMFFLSVSMGTVMAGNDTENKKLTIIDSGGTVKENPTVETGEIPKIGDISSPSTTSDITGGLGIFKDMGQFLLKYEFNICIFGIVFAIVALAIKAAWARGNNKPEEAADTQRNQKGLIIDIGYAMVGLLVVFCIFAPYVKSIMPS